MISSTPITCLVCESADVSQTVVQYPNFGNIDFRLQNSDPWVLRQCDHCSLIFRIVNPNDRADSNVHHESTDCSNHRETHHLKVDAFEAPMSLAFLQAEILSKQVGGQHLAVLDIGCYDGSLLREIFARHPKSIRVGCDIQEYPHFDGGERSVFVHGFLSNVTGQFDLICLSQSLQYITNLDSFFANVNRLLTPGGRIFIQAPNFVEKPCSMLLEDSLCHYSPASLTNMLNHFGFNSMELGCEWFPRDVFVVAKQQTPRIPHNFVPGQSIVETIAHIDTMAENIDSLDVVLGRTGVLGATVDAAFTNNRLGDCVEFFVDENPTRTGGRFHGKPILHLDDVLDDDRVVIPLGSRGNKVQQRLSRQYSGTFVSV
jgi:SAM-dependent methyltransferase